MKKYKLKLIADKIRKAKNADFAKGCLSVAYIIMDDKDLAYLADRVSKDKDNSPKEPPREEYSPDPEPAKNDTGKKRERGLDTEDYETESEVSESKEEAIGEPEDGDAKAKSHADHGAPPRAKNGKVDRGKVIALYNARWSAGKIADEMQCGLSTVYAILKEHTEGKLDNEVWNEEA